jgi:hypothetical protein
VKGVLSVSRLCCGQCKEYVYFDEYVYLDTEHTVFHKECYPAQFPVKDEGTYYDMVYKYDFFNQLRPFFPLKSFGEPPHRFYLFKMEQKENE